MKTLIKILVGLGTAWLTIVPIVAFVGFFTLMFFIIATGSMRDQPPAGFFIGYLAFILSVLVTVPIQLLTQGYYIVHVIRNREGKDLVKSLLGLGIFFMPFFALPIYYFIYILPGTPPDWALRTPNPQAGAVKQAVLQAVETTGQGASPYLHSASLAGEPPHPEDLPDPITGQE